MNRSVLSVQAVIISFPEIGVSSVSIRGFAPLQFGEEVARIHSSSTWAVPFGASEATIFSKRGSPRSGSQKGSSFNAP